MNLGVSGAGSAEGAAARGWFKELPRLFPGSCHIWGWGQTWDGAGGRQQGGCQEECEGCKARMGVLGLGVRRGENPACGNRNLLRCGVASRGEGMSSAGVWACWQVPAAPIF